MLGSLLEKEITTPEYYPLTLNALVNACNQKSNREPLVSYDEDTVRRALESLRTKGLVLEITGGGNRVPKHAQRFSEALNLGRRELAVLCELMLRGPQTSGELRSRAERLHEFTDLAEVESCLRALMERDPDPLLTRLSRQSGMKEPRYAHLLSGEVAAQESAPLPSPVKLSSSLDAEVRTLREEVEKLKLDFAEFRRQFE